MVSFDISKVTSYRLLRLSNRVATAFALGALILTVLNRLLLTLDTTEALRQVLYGIIVLSLAWVYVRLTGQKA